MSMKLPLKKSITDEETVEYTIGLLKLEYVAINIATSSTSCLVVDNDSTVS